MNKKHGFWYRFLILSVIYWTVFGIAVATLWTLAGWPLWGNLLFLIGSILLFGFLIMGNELVRLSHRVRDLEQSKEEGNG